MSEQDIATDGGLSEDEAEFEAYAKQALEGEAVEDEAPQEDAEGGQPEEAEAQAAEDEDSSQGDVEKDPLPYEELRNRYDNLNGALSEERGKRRSLEGKVEKFQEFVDRLQSDQKKADEPQPPDPEENPLEAVKYYARKVQELEQRNAQTEEQRQTLERERASRAHLGEALSQQEAEYAKTVPDYYDAAQFMLESRVNEMRMIRPGMPQEQAYQAVINEALDASKAALERGANPAEIIYGLAKTRGYTPKAAETQPESGDEKIRRLANGQAASKGMPKGGKSNSGPPSLAEIAELDGDEFDKAFAEYEARMMRAK